MVNLGTNTSTLRAPRAGAGKPEDGKGAGAGAPPAAHLPCDTARLEQRRGVAFVVGFVGRCHVFSCQWWGLDRWETRGERALLAARSDRRRAGIAWVCVAPLPILEI